MKDLRDICKDKIVITAHRGTSGGNIPCNTMAAYEIAYRQGADMLEIDLNMSADRHLIIFHPGMEPCHLGFSGSVRRCTLTQIQDMLRYLNYDRTQTEWTLCTFDDVLEEFKDKCYINVDKFWDYPEEIAKAIKHHNMMDQIVVKTGPSEKVFDILEQVAPEIMFLPIYNGKDNEVKTTHEELKKRSINYIGAELVFDNEDCYVGSPEFRNILHREDRIVWGNAILYDYRVPLAAGHSDDISLTKDPDLGWGWLADNEFDIIQTDWVLAMRQYLDETGKRFKSR